MTTAAVRVGQSGDAEPINPHKQKEVTVSENRSRRPSRYIALAKRLVGDPPATGWEIVAEGRSAQDCQRQCTEAGIEHMICRVHLVATPRQAVLWTAPRGRKPKVRAGTEPLAQTPQAAESTAPKGELA